VAGHGETRKKSILSLAEELARAETLGLAALVVHCGSRGDQSPAEARKKAADGFREAVARSETRSIPLALENSAGQGTSLAQDLGEWAELVASLPADRRAACLDTAHVFAAGHDLRDETERKKLIREVEEKIGWARIRVLHVNDSKTPCGSGVDRHEHLGQGKIGTRPYGRFCGIRRWRGFPGSGSSPRERKRTGRT